LEFYADDECSDIDDLDLTSFFEDFTDGVSLLKLIQLAIDYVGVM